jgi:serine/threonine protein kinase
VILAIVHFSSRRKRRHGISKCLHYLFVHTTLSTYPSEPSKQEGKISTRKAKERHFQYQPHQATMPTFTAPSPNRTPSPEPGNFLRTPPRSPPSRKRKASYSTTSLVPLHGPKRRGRLGAQQTPNSFSPTGVEAPGQKAKLPTSTMPKSPYVWPFAVHTKMDEFLRQYLQAPKYQKTIPREIENNCLREQDVRDVFKVMNHPNLVNLVTWDGFKEDQEDVRKATAWEMCDAGTLNRLLIEWADGLPESLIWHTLVSLLRAVHFLARGHDNTYNPQSRAEEADPRNAAKRHDLEKLSEADKERIQHWRPILHNQINPANIFYCHPPKESQPPGAYKKSMYGKCKLGNFSRAVVLEHGETYFPHRRMGYAAVNDSLNLDELYAKGVEGEQHGYRAPEMSSYAAFYIRPIDRRVISEEKEMAGGQTIGTQSDIFSIGAVAVVMMTGGKSIWDLVMRESVTVHMMARRGSQIEGTVWPVDRWEKLAAVIDIQRRVGTRRGRRSPQGRGALVDILPQAYSKELRNFLRYLLHPNPMYRLPVNVALEEAERLRRRRRRRRRRTKQKRKKKKAAKRKGSAEEAEEWVLEENELNAPPETDPDFMSSDSEDEGEDEEEGHEG